MQLSVEFLALADACAERAPFVKMASPPTFDYKEKAPESRDDLVYQAGKLLGKAQQMDTSGGLFGQDYSENRAQTIDLETAARKKLKQIGQLDMDDDDRRYLTDAYKRGITTAQQRRAALDDSSPIHNMWRDSFGQKVLNWVTGHGYKGETDLHKETLPDMYKKQKEAWEID